MDRNFHPDSIEGRFQLEMRERHRKLVRAHMAERGTNAGALKAVSQSVSWWGGVKRGMAFLTYPCRNNIANRLIQFAVWLRTYP